MRDRHTYDGNVTILGLDSDVVEMAQTVKDPKLRRRLDSFHLAGHQFEKGRDDMWDALEKDGIPPKEGSDFAAKLVSYDYDKLSAKGLALSKQGINPTTAESFTRELHNEVVNEVVSYAVDKTGFPSDRSDVIPALQHIHKDENTKKLMLLGKMPARQALGSAAQKTKTTITGLAPKEDFFEQAQAQAKSKSSSLEDQRQSRVTPPPTPPTVRVKPPQPKGPRPPKSREIDSLS